MEHSASRRAERIQVIRLIHLWLTLILGAPVVLVSAAGLPITYWGEADALLSPAYYSPRDPAASVSSFDALAAAARSVAGVKSLNSIYLTPRYGTAQANVTLMNGASREVSLDSGAARVIATRDLAEAPISWIYSFHTRLLLDRLGSDDAGRACVIVLAATQAALLLTGLLLWWPRDRIWSAIKPAVRKRHVWRDLHSKTGVYVAPIMLIVCITAILLSIPATRTMGIESRGHKAALLVPVQSKDHQLGLAELAQAGAVHGAGHAIAGIFDIDGNGPLLVLTTGPSEEDERWASVDRHTASLIRIDARNPEMPEDVPFLLLSLHQGQHWGPAGKMVFALASLIPLMLYVAGLVIWLRRSSRKRAAAGSQVHGSSI